MRASYVFGGVAAALGVLSIAAAAQAADTVALGKSVAATATVAEKTVDKAAAVRPAVRDAVKQVLVKAGPKPQDVLTAIDTIFTICRAKDGAPAPASWSCPAKEETYSALLEVRGLVVALLDSPEPAAIGGDGDAAFSTFPVTTTSGSSYREFSEK